MSMHTPGPWIVAEDQVQDEDGNDIADVTLYNEWNTTEGIVTKEMPWEANARLIAAAPEMFEFIRKVLRWELVDCDIHEYVMDDDEMRVEAQKLLLKIFPDYYQSK